MSEPRKSPAVRYLLPIGAFVLAIALYQNTRGNQFILDDEAIIVANPDLTTKAGLLELWTDPYHPRRAAEQFNYRPITILSFNLNAFLSEYREPLNFWRYRFVNIVLLGLLGWLTAWWFGRYVDHPVAGWLAVLLLIAHPTNMELINHIVGRADLLAMVGVIGFALSHRRALLEGQWDPPVALAAFVFAVAAFGAKETGFVLVPLVLAQAWLGGARRYKDDLNHVRKVNGMAVAIFALPMFAYLVGRVNALGALFGTPGVSADLDGNPLAAMTFAERLPAALALAWHYFSQLFAWSTAYNQVPAHIPTWASIETYLGIAVLLVALVAMVQAVRKRHWNLLPLVIAGSHFVLVSNLVVPTGVYAAHRLMLPFTLAAASIIASWLDRMTSVSTRRRAVAVLPVAAIGAYMAFVVFANNGYWANTVARRGHDSELQPMNPVARYHFGVALANKNNVTAEDWTNARNTLIGTAESFVDEPSAVLHHQIGVISARLRDDAMASEHLRRALQINPQLIEAHLALADLMLDRHNMQGAEQHINTATELLAGRRGLSDAIRTLLQLQHRLDRLRLDASDDDAADPATNIIGDAKTDRPPDPA